MSISGRLSLFNPLFRTVFRTTVMSIIGSVFLMSIIAIVFIPLEEFLETMLMTVVVSGAVSYFSASRVFNLRRVIEEQRIKLALERERACILSNFMRDAAHEFRTPLTTMETSLYLTGKTTDPQKQQQHLQRVREEIDLINRLLDTILILTRLDSTDKASYPLETVNAACLISDIPARHPGGRLKLLVETPASLPDVQVNISDFNLAIKQIVDNALRYSPDTSTVTVQLEASPLWVILRVRDQGHGMSPQTLERSFARFYRADESHSTPGLGLGLAVARQVIELHGGRIEIESEVGKGTTVTICLPVSVAS